MTEPLTQKRDGTWLVLPYGQPVTDTDGTQASYDTVMQWSVPEQEAFGVFQPEPAPAPPEGEVETSRSLRDYDDRPIWSVIYAEAPPPPPEPVPTEISPRQLLIGLAAKGWITAEEALAAATAGTPPTAVEGVFKALPEDQQLPARITWARMTTVLRTDPLVPLLAAAKGQNEAAVDDFFRVYSKV